MALPTYPLPPNTTTRCAAAVVAGDIERFVTRVAVAASHFTTRMFARPSTPRPITARARVERSRATRRRSNGRATAQRTRASQVRRDDDDEADSTTMTRRTARSTVDGYFFEACEKVNP